MIFQQAIFIHTVARPHVITDEKQKRVVVSYKTVEPRRLAEAYGPCLTSLDQGVDHSWPRRNIYYRYGGSRC